MGTINNIECNIERLTNGPKHHLFGFHDLLITNTKGDKYLSLEVDTINRPPLPGELFGVGYVKDGQYTKVGTTTALNYPQGARQQWVADSELFTVNNRVGDVWGTDLYDTTSNNLIERFEATTHMLSKDGRYAYGLDYARLFRLGAYGYTGLKDIYADEWAPSKAGITKMDLKTGLIELLVSVKQVAKFDNTGVICTPHYLTHLCLNPSCTRLAFLHRYTLPDGGGMTRLMTIGVDGTNLRCLAKGFLSHYDWKDDNTIYIFGRANSSIDSLRNNPFLSNALISKSLKLIKTAAKVLMKKKISSLGKGFITVTDELSSIITPLAPGIFTEDGHPMTNPVYRNWCSNDTYPDEDGVRTLMLYNFLTNERFNLGRFKRLFDKPDMALIENYFKNMDLNAIYNAEELSFVRSGLHCDLHPRWTRDGKIIAFDSIHEGSRQIYSVNVESLINY